MCATAVAEDLNLSRAVLSTLKRVNIIKLIQSLFKLVGDFHFERVWTEITVGNYWISGPEKRLGWKRICSWWEKREMHGKMLQSTGVGGSYSKCEKARDQREQSKEAARAELGHGASAEMGRSYCGQPQGWWHHSPPPSTKKKANGSLGGCDQ